MNDSTFDPQSFLDASISEPSIKRPPLPAGSDFTGIITDIIPRPWVGKKDPSKSGIAMDVKIDIDLSGYPNEKAALGGIEKITLQDGIMLDTTPSGSIDNGPGKNAKLRRYREAVDMNKPGDVFSFRAMIGRPIKVKIKHEAYEGEMYDKVDSVARA